MSKNKLPARTDLILDAEQILCSPDQAPLHEHSILIENGKISGIFPTVDCQQTTSDIRVNCEHHLLFPGLINAHTHSPMSLLKGIADDLDLETWLNQHIWPLEGALMSEEFIQDGCNLALAEMIRSGTTCFSDMYFFPNIIAACAKQAGLRAVIGLPILEFPSVWAEDASGYIEKGLSLADELNNESLLRTALAPHSTYTVAPETLRKVSTLSDELEKRVHIHVQETAAEIKQVVAQYGMRPMDILKESGLINPQLIAVHLTQFSEDDIEELSKRNANIIHCPESNHKLASGICDITSLMDKGINVALGTDGSASNNDLNMLAEMRTAAFTAKTSSRDATAVNAQQAFAMATTNAAKALDLSDHCGRLEVGMSADIVAMDLNTIEASPVNDPLSHLIYSASRESIRDVWVAGKQLLRDRKLTTLDEDDLLARARHWREQIKTAQASFI